MPWRSIILFGVGVFFFGVNISDTEAAQTIYKCGRYSASGDNELRYGGSWTDACQASFDAGPYNDPPDWGFCRWSVSPEDDPNPVAKAHNYTGECFPAAGTVTFSRNGTHGTCEDGQTIDPLTGDCSWPPPDCSTLQGKSMVCGVPQGAPYPSASGCHLGCTMTDLGSGVDVVSIGGGDMFFRYTFTGESCEPAGVEFCSDYSPPEESGAPGGVDDDGLIDLDGNTSISPDGDEGIFGDGGFYQPPPGQCSYSDDGIMTCDDGTGTDGTDADGEVGIDNNGDGEQDDGYTFADHWGGSVPDGATVVDAETGDVLGTAIDQDGDGITDGIDTDGDGDIDVDDPLDPGGGCDNNGDGVCDGDDLDNDGDGQAGGAGDCTDDPETDENECDGTGEGGGGSVSGLSCSEEPACQPDKDDPQGVLFCAQLKLQHQVSCQYYVEEAEGHPDSLLASKAEDDGSKLFEEVDLAQDSPGLSEGRINAAGGCYQDITIQLLGQSINIPMSALCPYFSAAGALILIIAYMLAGFIIYRGVF